MGKNMDAWFQTVSSWQGTFSTCFFQCSARYRLLVRSHLRFDKNAAAFFASWIWSIHRKLGASEPAVFVCGSGTDFPNNLGANLHLWAFIFTWASKAKRKIFGKLAPGLNSHSNCIFFNLTLLWQDCLSFAQFSCEFFQTCCWKKNRSKLFTENVRQVQKNCFAVRS